MPPRPIYTPESVRVVHRLNYDWTAWLKKEGGGEGRRGGGNAQSALHRDKPGGGEARLGQGGDGLDRLATGLVPVEARLRGALEACRDLWTQDGLTLDTWAFDGSRLQVLVAADPAVSPAFAFHRLKGRLTHALRTGAPHPPIQFRRNVGFRTLGENTRSVVDAYIGKQAGKSDYVDPRFKQYLGRFTVENGGELLAQPVTSGHGRYWYNLHLVIVVQDRRFPMTRGETFRTVRSTCFQIAAKKGHRLASISVMPDHVHLSLCGAIEDSPMDIGLAYLNNLAYVLGQNRCWSEEFYVGTFSEYDLAAIRSD